MHTLVIASRKGGTGKTTVATHLAVEAARVEEGLVAVIDTDPMEGLTSWWNARKAPTPILRQIRNNAALEVALDQLRREGTKVVVIDTPPAVSQDVANTIRLADFVLVPVQASIDDLRALRTTVDTITHYKKKMSFVLNRVKPRVGITQSAILELSNHGPMATTMLGDRVSYSTSKIGGATAPEMKPETSAAKEIADLWNYVSEKMKG